MNSVRNPEGEKDNFVPVINYEIVSLVKGPSIIPFRQLSECSLHYEALCVIVRLHNS